jgi:hypothetical protein
MMPTLTNKWIPYRDTSVSKRELACGHAWDRATRPRRAAWRRSPYFDRPVITTDVGGLAEHVPHEQAGLVVPPEDPVALVRAVTRFFADDGLATARR